MLDLFDLFGRHSNVLLNYRLDFTYTVQTVLGKSIIDHGNASSLIVFLLA